MEAQAECRHLTGAVVGTPVLDLAFLFPLAIKPYAIEALGSGGRTSRVGELAIGITTIRLSLWALP